MSLSELQQRVASLVFSLAEADGFALAGGGALIAHDVVDRTTRDFDCFGPSRDAVDRLWPAIRDSLFNAGLRVDVHALRARFTRRTLESLAVAKDLGFNLAVLREAIGVLDDLPRSAFEVDDSTFALIRAEFHSWRDEIGTDGTLPP